MQKLNTTAMFNFMNYRRSIQDVTEQRFYDNKTMLSFTEVIKLSEEVFTEVSMLWMNLCDGNFTWEEYVEYIAIRNPKIMDLPFFSLKQYCLELRQIAYDYFGTETEVEYFTED